MLDAGTPCWSKSCGPGTSAGAVVDDGEARGKTGAQPRDVTIARSFNGKRYY